jgi:hypothetical protein
MCQERRRITFSHNQKTSSVGGLMCGPAVFFLRFLVGRTVYLFYPNHRNTSVRKTEEK